MHRRFDLPDIIPRLVYAALRTLPMPERLLKLRLACGVVRKGYVTRRSGKIENRRGG